jgi:hypothetical protein
MNEFESALFEPAVILPSQCGDTQCGSDASGPIALMLAVLEEAAACIERGRQRRGLRKLAAEAEAWMRCDSREWPFAFASICDVLGLDVDAVRARLLADGQSLAGGRRRRSHRRRPARRQVGPGRRDRRSAHSSAVTACPWPGANEA